MQAAESTFFFGTRVLFSMERRDGEVQRCSEKKKSSSC